MQPGAKMPSQAALLAAVLRNDFCSFLRKCFNTIAPDTPFVENWHLHATAWELLRVRDGKVNRLIFNQPPRSLKSISVSVAFVAWLMGHARDRLLVTIAGAAGGDSTSHEIRVAWSTKAKEAAAGAVEDGIAPEVARNESL